MCRERKPREDFYANKSRGAAVTGRCKDCDKKRAVSRREYMRQYMAKNRIENPHKWNARKEARSKLTKQPCVVCNIQNPKLTIPTI